MELRLRNFRVAFRLSEWAERRFTPAGLVVACLLTGGALFGLDTRQSSAYQVFALAAALLLAALLAGARFQPRLGASRALPEFATVGEPVEYTLTLTNRGRAPVELLLVRDEPEARFPDAAEFRSAQAPADAAPNWFDRRVGYPRFAWLTRNLRGVVCEEAALLRLPAGGSAAVRLRLTPLRRGVIKLAAVSVARTDPLGLLRRPRRVPCAGSLLVLPRRYQVPKWTLPGQRVYQPGGVSLAARVGDSEEFMALREYQPGDPIRRVDWKGWARLGRPIVRQYQDEYFVRHALVLDSFVASPAALPAFEAAVAVAASFATARRATDALLDLMFVESHAYRFTAGRGTQPVEGLLRVLACVMPARAGSFEELARAVLAHAERLSGCICVLLDWDAPRQQLAQRLLALGVPLRVLVIGGQGAAPPEPGPMAVHPGSFHFLAWQRLEQELGAL